VAAGPPGRGRAWGGCGPPGAAGPGPAGTAAAGPPPSAPAAPNTSTFRPGYPVSAMVTLLGCPHVRQCGGIPAPAPQDRADDPGGGQDGKCDQQVQRVTGYGRVDASDVVAGQVAGRAP